MVVFAVINGFMDDVAVEKISDFEAAFLPYMKSTHPDIAQKIASEKVVSDETSEDLKVALRDFKSTAVF